MSERERFERWWASEGVERLPGGTIEWAKDAAWLAWLAASPAAPTPKPENLKWENLKWLLDASNQVIKELGKQEHLDSETFRWLRNAVGQVERDLQRALQVAGVPSGKLEELQNAANWMWEQAERKDIGPSRREAFELSARRLDAALAEEGK